MRLPPLNALVMFEAAARHLNFTRTADELRVTQAAVSRQIQQLEDHLGAELFYRQARGLKLTREGLRLQSAVSIGLENIANAAVEIRQSRGESEVTVSTSVAFASYWLMSRIAKFRVAHPEVELRLVASSPVADLARAGIDLAVRYGRGRWPATTAEHLLDNEIYPICAPSYLQTRVGPPPRRPSDLLGETLLHLVEFDRNWVTWNTWLKRFGVTEAPRQRGLEFDNYLVLVQAALDGQGIALGGGRLADDFLARGALIRPLKETIRSDSAFYLLHPSELPISESAALFRDWIRREARESERVASMAGPRRVARVAR